MFWLLPSVFSPGRPAPLSRGCTSRVAARPRSSAPCVRGSGFSPATGRVAGRRRRLPRGHGARVVSSGCGCWSNGFGRSMTRWPKDSLDPAGKRRNAVARRKAEVASARLRKELCGHSALVFRWSPTAASRAVAGVAPPAGFAGALLRRDGEACRQRGCAVVTGRRVAAASAGCVFAYASRAAGCAVFRRSAVSPRVGGRCA